MVVCSPSGRLKCDESEKARHRRVQSADPPFVPIPSSRCTKLTYGAVNMGTLGEDWLGGFGANNDTLVDLNRA